MHWGLPCNMANTLTALTHTGKHTALLTELVEQIEDWDMYSQSDNFAGWLCKKFIMEGDCLSDAKRKTINLLTNGSDEIIDVRV